MTLGAVARVLLLVVAVAALYPAPALARGRAVIVEFQPSTDEEAGLAFLLYDYVAQQLVESSGGGIVAGEAVQLYLGRNAVDCGESPACLQKLGQRFGAELVVTGVVSREGATVRVRLDFFASADGSKLGELKRSFPAGEDSVIGVALREAIGIAMPDALAVADRLGDSGEGYGSSGGSRGGSGATRRGSDSAAEERRRADEDSDRRREEEEARERRAEEERLQREADRRARLDERRREEADRRSAEDERRRQSRDAAEARSSRAEGRKDERRGDDRRAGDRRGSRRDDEEVDFLEDDVGSEGGETGRTARSAVRIPSGMSAAEHRRFERSGLSEKAWKKKRYAHGRVLSMRVAGGLAAGAVKQLYSTTIHLDAEGAKDDEYGWGTTGNATSFGFAVGLGFSVADMVEIGVEGGAVFGQQLLRRECDEPAGADPHCRLGTDIGSAAWDSGPAVHALIDPRVRVFLLPRGAVKPYVGFGIPILIQSGFDVPEEGYTDRPGSVLVGVEPALGVQIDSPGGLGFYVDAPIGILAGLGKSDFVADAGGGQLSDEAREAKPDPVRVLFRLNAGVQIRF